jgi:antitoxin (DNA-binding transcriptional repressor) of toxin-antitoxin stability system
MGPDLRTSRSGTAGNEGEPVDPLIGIDLGCTSDYHLVKVGQPMPKAMYNLYEAKTSLSKLVDRAAAGEEIVIAKAGKPMARLTAFPQQRLPRVPGGWEGRIWIAPDFDEPLPEELLDAFEGRGDAG